MLIRLESEQASVKSLRQELDEWMARSAKRQDELERLRASALKNGHKGAFEFNQAHADAIINGDLN